MAQFTQLINREADLKAILSGYEQAIQNDNWLAEAVQKDGIQNSWGARLNKKGHGWSCKILFQSSDDNKFPSTLIIEDSGTAGLTGSIPQNKDEEAEILMSRDPQQRLGRFLSSNWSEKTEHSLGSRGRGKMIFVGASRKSRMYFDSIRSDDEVYVFGSTFLDENKEMQVEIFASSEAHKKRQERLGENFPRIKSVGTRIIIPDPKKEVSDVFSSEIAGDIIKDTWWEIIQKYEAKIYIGSTESHNLVSPSAWLPTSNSGMKERKEYKDINVGDGLKIKRISLVYLKDKSVPEAYQGITIQRDGMKIQNRKLGDYLTELPGNSIYGAVELDKSLNDEMLKLESAEHYSFVWNKNPALKVHRIIKTKISEFAREYKIIEEEKHGSKELRETETAIQRELNNIAKSMGLSGIGNLKPPKPPYPPEPPRPMEPIRLSIPEFETPTSTGRVNFKEHINGLFAQGISDFNKPLKVSIEIWVYREGGINIAGLNKKQEIIIGKDESLINIGWPELIIDNRFSKGCYHLKTKMIALEDKDFGSVKVEKADVLYREVSRSFWVEEEPPAKGFFRDIINAEREKNRYVWWDDDEDGYYLFWNRNHPLLQEAINNNEILQDILRKEGTLALWSIVLATSIADPDNINGKLKKMTEEIRNQPIETQVKWILEKRGESLSKL